VAKPFTAGIVPQAEQMHEPRFRGASQVASEDGMQGGRSLDKTGVDVQRPLDHGL
jgi:hypothetical protein